MTELLVASIVVLWCAVVVWCCRAEDRSAP